MIGLRPRLASITTDLPFDYGDRTRNQEGTIALGVGAIVIEMVPSNLSLSLGANVLVAIPQSATLTHSFSAQLRAMDSRPITLSTCSGIATGSCANLELGNGRPVGKEKPQANIPMTASGITLILRYNYVTTISMICGFLGGVL